MNTTMLAGIAIAIIVIGGGAYILTRPHTGAQPGAMQEEHSDSGAMNNDSGAYTGSISDLAKRSGSWKCTLSEETAQAVSSGVVHVSDGKARGDFSTNVSGYGSVESHMIYDGAYVYTWSSVLPKGYKIAASASSTSATQTSGSGVSANQSYSYECTPEAADASRFALPAGVTFTAP